MQKNEQFQGFATLRSHSKTVGRGFESSRPCQEKSQVDFRLGFFQRCLPLRASYVDFISDVHFVSGVTPYGVVGKHLITATKGSNITMQSISSLRQSRNLTPIPLPSTPPCDTIFVLYNIKKVSGASKEILLVFVV